LSDAIRAIEQRRLGAVDEDDYVLALDLKNLLVEAGRDTDADTLITDMMSRLPDDVRFPICRAMLYLYVTNNAEEALHAINVALVRARRTGYFRREALGDKARILLQLGRGEELSEVLEEIMSLEMTADIPDIGRERDFVDRAPPGMIAEDVLARYDAFCPRR